MTKKLYWEAPYEIDFEAEIVDIAHNAIILTQTLFYPFGGGQLSDRGTLKIRNKLFEVQNVTKEGDQILHHLKSPIDKICDIGDPVVGKIDWALRYSLMKAHTSQHVLSASIKRKFNVDTAQAILEPGEVTIHLDSKISLEDLQEALEATITVCNDGREVRSTTLKQREASEKYSVRLRGKLPDEDPIRIVEIEGWDLMCCGGTHVSKTTEIGSIFIHSFNKGSEIKYSVGTQGLRSYSEANIRLLKAATRLSQPILKIDELVEQRLDEIQILRQNLKDLTLEFLKLLAQTPGTKIGVTDVKILDLPLDRKIITAGFRDFPTNCLLIVKITPLMVMILSSSAEVPAHQLIQGLNIQFGGKGGGGPKVAQGSVGQEIDHSTMLSFITHFLQPMKD